MLFPEYAGDVLEGAIFGLAEKPLIGGGLAERTQMAKVWANFDVVEVGLVDERRDTQPPAVHAT